MTDVLRVASWGMLVAPLAFFYFYTIDWAIKTGAVTRGGVVESVVLGTMLIRLGVVMYFKRLRLGRIWAVVDIFAIEVLVAAALVFHFLLTGSQADYSALSALVQAWPAAVVLVVPGFALYRFTVAIVGRARLSVVVPSAVGLFVLLLIPAEAASSLPPQNLGDISRQLLIVALGLVGSRPLLPEETVAGLFLYVALLFYIVTTVEGESSRTASLTVATAGTATVLVWGFAGSLLSSDLALVFVVPAAVILGLIWGVTRGD